jgi:hypothetical protein
MPRKLLRWVSARLPARCWRIRSVLPNVTLAIAVAVVAVDTLTSLMIRSVKRK